MKKELKQLFIPHPENNHAPHILRGKNMMVILLIVLLIEFFLAMYVFWAFPVSKILSDVASQVIIEETNKERVQFDLSHLQVSPLLQRAAQQKADDMAHKGYFSHQTPDGKNPWDFISDAGYEYTTAGENLAVNFFDSQEVVNAWMASQSHRENILNTEYTQIGIGIAKGQFQGKDAVFVVQFFARPTLSTAISQVLKDEPISKKTAVTDMALLDSSIEGAQTSVQKKEPTVLHKTDTLIQKNPNSAEKPIAISSGTISQVAEYASELSSQKPVQITFLKKIASEPYGATSVALVALMIFMFLVLLMKIFIAVDVQHPLLIAHGVLMLAFLYSALTLNKYLFLAHARIL